LGHAQALLVAAKCTSRRSHDEGTLTMSTHEEGLLPAGRSHLDPVSSHGSCLGRCVRHRCSRLKCF